MRIVRFSTGGDPAYGVLTGDLDEHGQPSEDAVVVAHAGDPHYVGMQPLEQQHRLADVRLLAPVLPRSKVVGIGRNHAAYAAELGNDVLLTQPGMSRLVARLEAAGLVERVDDPEDGRACRIRLTQAGARAQRQVGARRGLDVAETMTRTLSSEQLLQLRDLCRALTAAPHTTIETIRT